jgi:tRNA threonylcarbamoyladenosine biosynthesis protein TsaE
MKLLSRSAEETRALGERLGARLGAGDVVACIGALGAGKTCFLQGLARGLGVDADVTSPTFVLVNEYPGRVRVYHIDAYRTESLAELVEWADKLLPLLPPRTVIVGIDGLGDEPREIDLSGPAEILEGISRLDQPGE